MAATQKGASLRFSLRSLLVFALMIALLWSAWSVWHRQPERTVTATPDVRLTDLPVEMTVSQRSTAAVPGSDGKLLLTVDDITRGQVMTSLASASGDSVLASRSMSSDDVARFQFGNSHYSLTLKQLSNALIGEDVAAFVISESFDPSLTEKEKIEELISAVAELQDVKFLRNGVEHSATEAADHLRRKWRAAGDKIETAEQFIEAIASKSSLSGEPYRIRMPDGEIIEAEAYLRRRLSEVE